MTSGCGFLSLWQQNITMFRAQRRRVQSSGALLTYRSFVNLEPCLGHSRDSDEDLPSMWRRLERQPQRSGVDPAEQVLMQEREARSRRKREETEVELEKIHSRIKFVLQEANVDSEQKLRAQDQHQLRATLHSYQDTCEQREHLLQALHQSLDELSSGSLLPPGAEELEEEESDVQGLEAALHTAQHAANRLAELQRRMAQLFSMASSFPDTKKGRKKLERALVQAQEEGEGLRAELQGLQRQLEQSRAKCKSLQVSSEQHLAECVRVKKALEDARESEAAHSSLQADLSQTKAALQRAVGSLEQAQAELQQSSKAQDWLTPQQEQLGAKVCELESLLSEERERCKKLTAENEKLDAKLSAVGEQHGSACVEEREEEEQLAEGEGGSSLVDVGTQTLSTVGELSDEEDGGDGVKGSSQTLLLSSLQAQLTKEQSKHRAELEAAQKLISDLQNTVEEGREGEDLPALRRQVEGLQARLSNEVRRRERVEAALEDSRSAWQAQEAPQDTCYASPSFVLVDHSTQWSHSSECSGKQQSLEVSSCDMPLITMDEVLSAPPSLPLSPHPSPPLASGFTLESFPLSRPRPAELSLNQSLASLPVPGGMGHRLPSPGPGAGQLTYDHPIVGEWIKCYEAVMGFKAWLTAVLERRKGCSALVEELSSLEPQQLQHNQSLQGQITEMRFSVALMLHGIQRSLEESLSPEAPEGEQGGAHVPSEDDEVVHLKEKVAELSRSLKQSQRTYKIELEESKDTIATLANRVESLRTELSRLKPRPKPRPSSAGDRSRGEGSTMFTRLDSAHNLKALSQALRQDHISPAIYQAMANGMESYLSLPGKRLALLGRRRQDLALCSQLLGSAGTRLAGRLRSREQGRQERWRQEMREISAQRAALALSITKALSSIELSTGIFLIKPIYGNEPPRQRLISRINRPLPIPQGHSALHTTHKPSTSEWSLSVSRPPTSRHTQATPTQATPTHRRLETESLWTIHDSRPSTRNVCIQTTPTVPKALQLEIARQRCPKALLHEHNKPTGKQLPPIEVV